MTEIRNQKPEVSLRRTRDEGRGTSSSFVQAKWSSIVHRYFFSVLCLLSSILCLLSSNDCFAADITFEATVDRARVSVGTDIQLNLTFHGTQDVTTPYFPGVEGFGWQYLGPSSLTSIINGKISNSITHRYKLVALKAGKFEIPSFSVQHRGRTYISKPIPIEVGGQMQSYRSKAQGQDLGERAFLILQVDKRKAYVNEIIPLTIKLYVERDLVLRDIYYPQIPHKGFSIEDFSEHKQYQENLRGVAYNVVEFNTDIFAVRAGELTLGPAELKCKLVVRERAASRFRSFFFDDDFFARYQARPMKLASIDMPIIIASLPAENVPEGFNGALGNYRFSLEANPKEVKVGDPITLRLTVSGEGNLKTVSCPEITFNDDFKVYESQVSRSETSKTFEQVIIPRNGKISEIPRIGFSFFDPHAGQYKEILRGPVAIKVHPLPKGEQLRVFEIAQEDKGVFRRGEILGRDIIYIKDAPGRLRRKGALLCKNKLFVVIHFIPLLAIIVVLIFQRRKERLQADIGYARRLRAPGKAKKNLLKVRELLQAQQLKELFDAVFKTLQEYLGDKFHLATAGITSNVVEELKARNIDQKTLEKVGECFSSCDIARYAPSSISKEQMFKVVNLLEEIIDELERIKV